MTEIAYVSVIIPARNEAENLAPTIASVEPWAGQIIVVDDGSQDQTPAIAEGLSAEVMQRRTDPGKGQSLAYGLTRARGDIVVFLDADLRHSAKEGVKLVECVAAGRADLAIARIDQVGDPGWGLLSQASRRLVAWHGVHVSQPLCGQRALSRVALEKILPLARGWGVEVAMLVQAARQRLVVEEVPTSMYHSGTGRSARGALHRARQGLDIAVALSNMMLVPWR